MNKEFSGWTADEVRDLLLKIAGGPISVTQRVELFDIASNYAEHLEAATLRQQAARVDEYALGWRMAAQWAGRDDLIADIGSPAYEKDKAANLITAAALAQNKQAERTGGEGEAVGTAVRGYGGSSHLTFAHFPMDVVPAGTKLYLHPPAQQSGVAVSDELAHWIIASVGDIPYAAMTVEMVKEALHKNMAVAPLLAGRVPDGWEISRLDANRIYVHASGNVTTIGFNDADHGAEAYALYCLCNDLLATRPTQPKESDQ